MLKKLSETFEAKFTATTRGHSELLVSMMFHRNCLSVSKPSIRLITAAKRKKKGGKRKGKNIQKVAGRKPLSRLKI